MFFLCPSEIVTVGLQIHPIFVFYNHFKNQQILMKTFILTLILINFMGVALATKKLEMFVGRGYDILHGNPFDKNSLDPGFRSQIIDFQYANNNQTTDNMYLIPDHVGNSIVAVCSLSSTVKQFTGTQSYQDSLKVKAQVSGGYKGILKSASFTASNSYQQMYESTISEKKIVTYTMAECSYYDLSLDLFRAYPLSENFILGVKHSLRTNNWENFIAQYGTHFAFQAFMGGRAVQEIQFSRESASLLKALDIDIEVAAKATYANYFGDASFDLESYSSEKSYTEQLSININEFYVGGTPTIDQENGTDIQKWKQSVISRPMPISYRLRPISDLFFQVEGIDASAAERQFYLALDNYCSQSRCSAPSKDLDFPTAATVTLAKTQSYGGNGGSKFEWFTSSPTMQVKKVLIRNGRLIDSLQFLVSDGVDFEYSPRFGGSGGHHEEWTVPDGEYITQVELRTGSKVDSITFITNKGTKSKKYGQNGGSYKLITFPAGSRLVGFFGRSGRVIDKIGFITAKNNYI